MDKDTELQLFVETSDSSLRQQLAAERDGLFANSQLARASDFKLGSAVGKLSAGSRAQDHDRTLSLLARAVSKLARPFM